MSTDFDVTVLAGGYSFRFVKDAAEVDWIESDLFGDKSDQEFAADDENAYYKAAGEVIDSLLLAQFEAGVIDVVSPKFAESLETAIVAVCNNF